MGQRLSELRGYMLTMEGEEVSERENTDSNGAKTDGAGNGNVGEDLFEDIYGSKNEASGGTDELNGNGPVSSDCCAVEVACTCAPARTRTRKKDEQCKRTVRSSSSSSIKKCRPKRGKEANTGTKKRPHWGLRLNCARLKSEADIPDTVHDGCVCTGYRRTEPTIPTNTSPPPGGQRCTVWTIRPAIDLARFNPEDFPIEDCDERARLERAREMVEGVDPPPGFVPCGLPVSVVPEPIPHNIEWITASFSSSASIQHSGIHVYGAIEAYQAHSQVDYVHCLVPDLLEITSCSFYWGKMDRYEAERLLEGRPEGTFLLRDSAQEEHLFSVSFRKYERSLHARIEQWNHKFSFDSHDPGVFSSPTVTGLIEHYKDPSFCMFFEPMLTIPLHRTFTFPLQHLCRAVICSKVNYDGISRLPLPRSLKTYLREYHYKQRIRTRALDSDL